MSSTWSHRIKFYSGGARRSNAEGKNPGTKVVNLHDGEIRSNERGN